MKGDQIVLTTYAAAAIGAGSFASANGTAVSSLTAVTLADNTDVFVRGTYTAGTNTFVGAAAGTDTLVVYDGQQSGGTAYEAIVLVGYVAPSVTGINAASVAGGSITLS